MTVVIELEAFSRSTSGSRNARRSLNSGKIPAVIYSAGEQATPMSLVGNEFVKAARSSTTTQKFSFKSEDGSLKGRSAIVKDIQVHPLTGEALHVDFMELKDGRPIKVRVPLNVTGEPFGVKNQGGVLTVSAHEVLVEALPKDIPAEIVVDVIPLKLGENIHSKDLNFGENVTFIGNPNETVASIVASRTSVLMDKEAAKGAGEAGEGEAAGEAAAPEADK